MVSASTTSIPVCERLAVEDAFSSSFPAFTFSENNRGKLYTERKAFSQKKLAFSLLL